MRTVGVILAIGGVLLAAYFVWLYDTRGPEIARGVSLVDPGKVQMGQNGLYFGLGAGVVGALLFGFSKRPN